MISITFTGLDDIIAKLDKMENINKPVMEGIYQVMREAEAIALSRYSLQGNGNSDFHSDISSIDNGYMLTMSGEDIGFLEFGAGVFTEADEFASEVGYTVAPGSWSESQPHSDNPNARYFAKDGFWWWNNIRYTGLVPMRGMQNALEHIRDNLERAITEKINEWIEN